MKKFIYLILILFSTAGFSQNTGLIVGKVMDKELDNTPLVLANVSIKGTSVEVNTDLTGLFVIENLKSGDYILVCSFVGYETQEIHVHVDALNPAEVNLPLGASTISLSELASITSTSQTEDKTFSTLN
ncbi:carboxypeptidase-like regulatory domain-containing protein [Confluentibacter sediminis]|uniref:carboxypeptidase-like regulatory domain-containing protein n=1 Tax=Confluentibacter sediminis TaxID=2219045 RepID=UPI000DADEFFD|nr:carboxypeptidase-like regulatory domain-containing protein [Confluentibacter sediminis]